MARPDRSRGAPEVGEIAACSVRRVTCADVDEHAASLRDWNQTYEQLTPGRFVGSLQEFCCGGIQIFREATSQAVHETGGPRRGSRAFGVPVLSPGAALFRGEAVDSATMVTLGGEEELDFYTPRGFDILGLVFDESELAAHAREVEQRDIGAAIGPGGALRPGAERIGELRGFLESAMRSLDENPAALRYCQAQRVLTHSLMSAVVAAIPGDGVLPDPPRPNRRHVVDAAKAYMRAHISDTITVAELCAKLGVSRRTLQYSFQEVLGLSPVRFLRALRLNGVRRDLRNASAPADSVQDTAARWGFWHLGHFVADYKQMFGELPSQTLRECAQRRFAARGYVARAASSAARRSRLSAGQ